MSVLLAGTFPAGDPASRSTLAACLNHLEGEEVTVIAAAPDGVYEQFGLRSVSIANPAAVAREIAAADVLAFAGGPPFAEASRSANGGPSVTAVAAMEAEAKALGKRIAFVGVAVDDLAQPVARACARNLPRHADLFVARDRRSARRFASFGAPAPMWIGADPVWLGVPASTAGRRSDGGVVAAVAGTDGSDALAGQIADLESSGRAVSLLPWGPGGFSAVGRLASALRSPRVLRAPADMAAARDSFLGAAAVVCRDEHPVIAAASAGVSSVDPTTTPGGLAAAVDEAASSPPGPGELETHVLRAEECMRLLKVLLANGRSDEADCITGLELGPEPWPS
jgi:hypothetical protein